MILPHVQYSYAPFLSIGDDLLNICCHSVLPNRLILFLKTHLFIYRLVQPFPSFTIQLSLGYVSNI